MIYPALFFKNDIQKEIDWSNIYDEEGLSFQFNHLHEFKFHTPHSLKQSFLVGS
jgi:hypothetical protein